MRQRLALLSMLVAATVMAGPPAARAADDSDLVLSIDHFVPHVSTVPVIAGQSSLIYLRERVKAGVVLRSPSANGKVVLFVHGAGTPAEVAFDVQYQDYSWMAYLARAGFDVFSMDHTGYGPSTRPEPMNDPCNVTEEAQQAELIPTPLAEPCEPSYPSQLTTAESDWDEVDRVVDYLRDLRRTQNVNMVAWSLGGPRSGGYAARHPDKVDRLVLLAPVFNRAEPTAPPATTPAPGQPTTLQSRAALESLWQRQTGCADQVDPGIVDPIWQQMVASDPVGATWGRGVRRAPTRTGWGWTAETAATVQAPTLLVSGEHDVQVSPDAVRDLYSVLGTSHKVFLDMACSSHNAMWETRKDILFSASLEWLTEGTVRGTREGTLRLGD